jgi:hypothetical protein
VNALAACLDWANSGSRGFDAIRYETEGEPVYFAVHIWERRADGAVEMGIGFGESREDAAREALAEASARGLLGSPLAVVA